MPVATSRAVRLDPYFLFLWQSGVKVAVESIPQAWELEDPTFEAQVPVADAADVEVATVSVLAIQHVQQCGGGTCSCDHVIVDASSCPVVWIRSLWHIRGATHGANAQYISVQ